MSGVAGFEGGVELTKIGRSPTDGSHPAVLGVATEDQQPLARNESAHLRFQIEDVEETDGQSHDNQQSLTGQADITVTSFGYNTAEAVPMTVYYRHAAEDEGKPRPSIDYLRERKMDMPPPEPSEQEVSQEPSEQDEQPLTPKKRWQFWKRSKNKKPKKPAKFGWIQGVLIRCLLNIWGVMLFIRLSWVVGQSGILLASVIVLLSGVVTVITTLSMSAICTNGEVKGGGAYYLISRSLGPEFGGAIGIIFSLANAVAVALYVVGFAETCADLIVDANARFTGNSINDIRVIGFILVTLLLIVTLVGLDWEAKVQLILLGVLLIAITDFLVGSVVPRSEKFEMTDTFRGFTGFSGTTFVSNVLPQWRDGESFFTVFAVFFPAATGILAGANISGDLKNPQVAIPKGTLLAIGLTTVTYLGMAVIVGFVVLRDAPGTPEDFFNAENVLDTSSCAFANFSNISYVDPSVLNLTSVTDAVCGGYNFSANFPQCSEALMDECTEMSPTINCLYGDLSEDNLTRLCREFRNFTDIRCQYGLLNNFQVMAMVSAWSPLVTAGIFAATISSALTSLVSAPKVFQRVCQDRVFPYIHFFAKGGGRSGTEPIRAYILAYFIAVACIAIGQLNEIALIISMFFLMAYALINYSCFAASFAKSPGWRPSFKLFNKWVALFGAAICLAIMFVIRWYYALITLVVVAALYQFISFLKPDINWGSSTQAFYYSYSMRNLLKLEKLEDHVKNFRPQFLVLTGPPSSRPDMVHFFSHISRDVGVMVCGQILMGEYSNSRRQLLEQSQIQKKWLRREKVKAFHNIICARTVREGVQNLLQLSGLGKLRPNTLVVGFKSNWTKCSQEEVEEYVSLLHDAFDLNFAVVVFRLRAGFDATERMDDVQESVALNIPARSRETPESSTPPTSSDGLRMRGSGQIVGGADPGQPLLNYEKYKVEFSDVPLSASNPLVDSSPRTPKGSYHPIGQLDGDETSSVNSYAMAMEGEGRLVFEDEEDPDSARRESGPVVDTVPEIVTMPSRFEKVQETGYIDVWWLYDDGGLALLLPFLVSRNKHWKNCKLRIFTAGSSRNIDRARLRMTTLLRKFRINFSAVIEVHGINNRPSSKSIDKYKELPLNQDVDDKDLDKMTLRHIRLGELIREHSSEARLIVMTISVPLWSTPARQYMSWLEIMSQDLPPILLMRGNQSSVLTFYS